MFKMICNPYYLYTIVRMRYQYYKENGGGQDSAALEAEGDQVGVMRKMVGKEDRSICW